MKRLAITFFLAFAVSGFSQDSFINKYVGEWSGYMLISNSTNSIDTVVAKMFIAEEVKDSIWTWRTSYEGKFNIEKDYKLVKTMNPNEYLLDEGDGITLMLYKSDNKLISMFNYDDTHMFTQYEFLSDEIRFDIYITAYSKKRAVNEHIGDYPLLSSQKSVLTRLK